MEGYELLDDYMSENQNIELEDADLLKNKFLETLGKCLRTFDRPFVDTTQDKPRQSVAYYDLIMNSFKDLSDDFINDNIEQLNEKFKELCKLEEFQKTLAGGLQQKSSILRRRKLWRKKIEEINEN